MQAIAYIRVGPMGRGDVHSAERQRAVIQRWADQAGVTITDTVTELESGTGPLRQLDAAVGRMEAGTAGTVIVAGLDRLGRSLGTGAGHVTRASAAGRLVAVREGLDTSEPAGRMMAATLAGLAEVWH